MQTLAQGDVTGTLNGFIDWGYNPDGDDLMESWHSDFAYSELHVFYPQNPSWFNSNLLWVNPPSKNLQEILGEPVIGLVQEVQVTQWDGYWHTEIRGTVPEPSSLLLGVMLLVVGLLRRVR